MAERMEDAWAIWRLQDESDRYRAALVEITTLATVERNPDGEDQAAHTMQMVAQEALDTPSPEGVPIIPLEQLRTAMAHVDPAVQREILFRIGVEVDGKDSGLR